jgi:hypothetical protein
MSLQPILWPVSSECLLLYKAVLPDPKMIQFMTGIAA